MVSILKTKIITATNNGKGKILAIPESHNVKRSIRTETEFYHDYWVEELKVDMINDRLKELKAAREII